MNKIITPNQITDAIYTLMRIANYTRTERQQLVDIATMLQNLPDENPFDASRVVLPPVGDVKMGTWFGILSQDGNNEGGLVQGEMEAYTTDQITFPDEADVRFGVKYGVVDALGHKMIDKTGSVRIPMVPVASQVLEYVLFGFDQFGTVHLPDVADVKDGVTYGPNNELEGTYVP